MRSYVTRLNGLAYRLLVKISREKDAMPYVTCSGSQNEVNSSIRTSRIQNSDRKNVEILCSVLRFLDVIRIELALMFSS